MPLCSDWFRGHYCQNCRNCQKNYIFYFDCLLVSAQIFCEKLGNPGNESPQTYAATGFVELPTILPPSFWGNLWQFHSKRTKKARLTTKVSWATSILIFLVIQISVRCSITQIPYKTEKKFLFRDKLLAKRKFFSKAIIFSHFKVKRVFFILLTNFLSTAHRRRADDLSPFPFAAHLPPK